MPQWGVDTSEMDAFAERFREYARYNKRDLPVLLVKQGKEFAEECFLQTPRASASEIDAKVTAISPVFKRAPKGFAGKIAATDSSVTDDITKRQRKARRDAFIELTGGVVRRHKESRKKAFQRAQSEKPAEAIAYAQALHLTLAEQVKAAIIFRTRHIGATASSWLNAMRKLGSKMNAVKSNPNKFYSDVLIVEGDNPSVTIANNAPGIVKLAERTGFVRNALLARIDDMQVYINRKRAELATIFNPRGDK